MKKKILFVVILVMMLALCLCACNLFGGGQSGGGGNEGDGGNTGGGTQGEINTDGWEDISSIEPKDVYVKFLLGFTNVAYEISEDKIKTKKDITADAKIKLKINDNDFYLIFKAKYNYDNPETKTIVSLEFALDEIVNADTYIFGVYMYRNELYVNIANNKVKFSLENSNWTKYYPYKMEQYNNNKLSNTAGLLATNIKTNKEITGKYRRNSNKEEFAYTIDIDLDETLGILSQSLSSLLKDNSEMIETINMFIANLFGVTVEQLHNGEIPEGDVVLDFMISGNQIAKFDANVEIELSNSNSNLIDGDDLDMDLSLVNLDLTNNYANGVVVPFVNNVDERESYVSYSSAIYRGTIPMRMYDQDGNVINSNYNLKITTRIFQDDNINNFLFLEYYDTELERVDRAMYVYNNVVYFFETIENEFTNIYIQRADLSDIAERLVTNELNGDSTLDIYSLIAYIFKNISITDEEIRFCINSDMFVDVWYNYNDLINYVDDLVDGALKNHEKAMSFIEFITTNEVICALEYSKPFLEIVNQEDDAIEAIIDLLTTIPVDDNQENVEQENTEQENTEQENVGEEIE